MPAQFASNRVAEGGYGVDKAPTRPYKDAIPVLSLNQTVRMTCDLNGAGFFNPVPVMPLLEMVRSCLTSEETYQTARAFGESLGKQVIAAKDTPGFIVNALLVPYLLDAVRMLEEGIASKEDVDTGIHLGLNHPMGPLTLLDFVGIDTTLYIADAMFAETKHARYAEPVLIRRMVTAGYFGRKSGKGFYEYQ